jgi:type I restriction enzyme M protein
LPANLFYGTGIPACIVVLDKEEAHTRKGIFMLDASQGYKKDGPKNRLRDQDIHRIVDTFTHHIDTPKYARMVSFDEIEKNEYNLNLPRYIDSQEEEDLQDIEAHLKGGIPVRDIDALDRYWQVCPTLKKALFNDNRPGYLDLTVDQVEIKPTIFAHSEFSSFIDRMTHHFITWREKNMPVLKGLQKGCHPKEVIANLSEDVLSHYSGQPLIDRYDVYQHLMDYWSESMQDDCYLITMYGWKAETYRIIEKDKNGKEKDKGWTCDLIPKELIVARYFAAEQAAIDELQIEFENITTQITELEEEGDEEDGVFFELEKVNKANVTQRIKETRAAYIVGSEDYQKEGAPLEEWLVMSEKQKALKKHIKDTEIALDVKALAQYPKLSEVELQTLVVEDKWLASLETSIHEEIDHISQALTGRVKQLAERYGKPLPELTEQVGELDNRVEHHLERMGFAWK